MQGITRMQTSQLITYESFGVHVNHTARKVSKYGVISGPYFPAFGLNTERSECGEIRTRNNSVFGHFSCSAMLSLHFLNSIIKSRKLIMQLQLEMCENADFH